MTNQPTQPTKWHEILGTQLRLLLTPLKITVHTNLKVLSQPPEADILLLRSETDQWTAEQMACLPDGIRDTPAPQILIEFKFSESLTRTHLMKTIGYDVFYRQGQTLDDAKQDDGQVRSFILSSKTPQKAFRREYGYQPTERAGVFRSTNPLLKDIPLITLNDLADTPHNAFVKCFASRVSERRKAFAQLAKMGLGKLSQRLWYFLAGLRRTINLEGDNVDMTNIRITPEDVAKLGEELGNEWLDLLPVEAFLSRRTSEEILSYLSYYEPEEVLSYHKSMEQYLVQREKALLVQGLRRSLRIRFSVAETGLAEYEARLQRLDFDTLEQLSETVLLVDSEAAFEQALSEKLAQLE